MNIRHSTSLIAIATLLGATGVAMAGTTNTFDASVSVLSPDQSGFLIGGQVGVNGVGSGALTLSRTSADLKLEGGASSKLNPNTTYSSALDSVQSKADITSSLNFDRSITTSGSLVGLGAVTSTGEAIAALGSAGAASANTTTAGTRAADTDGTVGTFSAGSLFDGDLGGEGNASAEASSQGSLNGSLSTRNSLSLLGTSGLFAGSNGLTVGELNKALAYGASDVKADGATGIDLTQAASTDGLTTNGLGGGLFQLTSSLTGNKIAMSVSNAGNGSIAVSTSTGGFFTGGGAAAGSATFVDSNDFFKPGN